VGYKNFTIQDLIEHEKSDCRDGEELTFKLIGLSHYLDSDEEWKTRDGQTWDIARLIREELKQPILRVAACGGTHRLMGHSYALYKRRKQGKTIDGQFARAEKFIADYHKYAFSLQNQDGSFSTRWFEGREAKSDLDRKIKTTGHITEWMVFSLPEERLTDPRIVKAVNFLVTSLQRNVGREWEVGPHGHAIHALRIYDRRLFKPHDTPAESTGQEPPISVERKPAENPNAETANIEEEPTEPSQKAGQVPAVKDPLRTADRPKLTPKRSPQPTLERPKTLTLQSKTEPSPPAAPPEVPAIELAPE
jgi:hypothetical protein